MRFLCFLFLLALVSSVQPAAAQDSDGQPPLIDRELFFGDPEIAGAQLSPDGQHITFRKPYRDVMNIWIKGADEPFDAARPITADTERPVSGYFWSQDSRYVLYVQDKGGNENYHVYVVDPRAEAEAETGVPPARNVTPYEGARAYIYAVPEATPNHILVGLNDRDAQWHDVYRVDLATGERELLWQNEQNLAGFVFDLEGDLRLAARTTDDGSTEILRVDEDALTSVYTCSVEETCGPVRFHKDGERVYMITNKGDRDLTALILFNPETGEEMLVEADPEGQVDFGGAEFSDVTDELIATYYVGDRLRIYPKNDAVARDLELLREKLPEGEIYLGSATEDESKILVSVQRDVDPGSVYLYDREAGEVELLYRSRPELPSEHLAPVEALRYPTRDGLEIPAYLTLPKGVEAANLPTIIVPHGGPWARDTWGYGSFAQWLANRGYAVLQPNFRGSTGYGKAFLNAGNKEWGTGAMQHDLSDGVQYLIERGIADPDRVALMGGSYGGYATLAGLTFTPELYAAGVSIVGPSNLLTLLESIPPYWEAIRVIFHERMGDPNTPEGMAQLKAQSPFFHADKIDDPLLVIQGANDPRVKQAESDQIVVAARENDVDVAYLVAPDEGHGFQGEENRLAMVAAIEAFLAEHLGGRHQKDMPDDLAEHLASLMVDVETVELPDMGEVEAAASADLPDSDGDEIDPATLQYTSTMSVQGQALEMTTTRTITAEEIDDRDVWRVQDETVLPAQFGGMTITDTYFLGDDSLLPVKRSMQQGQMGGAEITYDGLTVKGEMQGGGQTIPIDQTLDAAIVGDGPGLDVWMAGLPLEVGYTAPFRTFNLMQQNVRPFKLTVTGEETVTVPAGSFETFVVQVEPLDGTPEGRATVHVTKDEPHYVVRSETTLPAMMGGGTLTTELSARGEPEGSN